ncbi:MAG: BCCT family transporter [Desulfofustis sp. PB-SRB1]|nr:BCCT family transporter [Desulfofustis sp. PB-SRB1]
MGRDALLCGIGASILYWAPIEWAYYYQNPPLMWQAAVKPPYSGPPCTGPFHWGPIAWSIYLVPAIPISYFFYVRRQPVLKVSTALRPPSANAVPAGGLGKIVDILFVFGLLGGGATTLGLAAPLINEGLAVFVRGG